jgi:Cytochrome c
MTPAAVALLLLSADPAAADRGKAALERTAFIPAFWPRSAYDRLWKQWGVADKPADYPAAVQDRYGLPPAPYPNDGLPMGLRTAPYLPLVRGVGIDCLTCHGGSLMGKSVVGLGNSSLDIQAVFEEFAAAADMPAALPFPFTHARGTNEAGAFSVYLLGMRDDDLNLRPVGFRDLGLKADSCEDVPAWWLLRKKKTMYHTGSTDARSVRSLMQFLMHPLAPSGDFPKHEPAFRDLREYLLALRPPAYPFPVDKLLAAEGKVVFAANCTKCHGTYGDEWTYPNKVIPLADIGTDPARAANIGPKFRAAYNASWFAREGPTGYPIGDPVGYQAPPLDGVWATAPYLHNGSVPTLAALLDSSLRPAAYTRSYRTGEADYDSANVGWKFTPVKPGEAQPGYTGRRVYDTTRPGRGNGGHTYGDSLGPQERRAVIEYLKTL